MQAVYHDMMRDHIAPSLRALGFVGSGSRFRFPLDDYHATLDFQRSAYSDKNRISFTGNVAIIRRDLWEYQRAVEAARIDPSLNWPEEPNANHIGPTGRAVRLGWLTHGQDFWWELTPRTTVETLANELVAAARECVVPFFRLFVAGKIPPGLFTWSPDEAELLRHG